MTRQLARGLGFGAAFAFALAGSASCLGILDVQSYEDAADKLCACPELASIPGCVQQTKTRLKRASAADRQAFLETFADTCADACGHGTECFDQPAVCTAQQAPCTTSIECCGASKGAGCCTNQEGSTCCSDCLSCGEVFGTGGAPIPQVSRCADSASVFAALFACVCDNCVSCAASCPDFRLGDVTPVCSACFKEKTKVGRACNDPLLACLEDKPKAP